MRLCGPTAAFDAVLADPVVGHLGTNQHKISGLKGLGAVADEARLLAAIHTPQPKGSTIRYGETYRATLPFDGYASLRDLPMTRKKTVVARCR